MTMIKKEVKLTSQFDKIVISLASPEKILERIQAKAIRA